MEKKVISALNVLKKVVDAHKENNFLDLGLLVALVVVQDLVKIALNAEVMEDEKELQVIQASLQTDLEIVETKLLNEKDLDLLILIDPGPDLALHAALIEIVQDLEEDP